jgi:hypothetical protein
VQVVLFDLSNKTTDVAAAILEIKLMKKKHKFELFFYKTYNKQKKCFHINFIDVHLQQNPNHK